MAQDMRVRTPTFKSIVKIYRETGRAEKKQRGGRSHNRTNDEHLQFIKDCVDENPSVTLGTKQEKMKNHFNIERSHSISGIDYALKNRIQYTLKQIHKYPERRNDLDIRIQRRDYCSTLTSCDISYSNNCIFIDESGFNLWLTKGYTRSERGLPAFQTVSSQRKRNISLMAAMSVNAVQFCATNNTKHGAPDQALIMDNCRIHTSSEVKQVME
ncbi:hypothetical protein G6F56_004843 [Rhizopus delemar]|nr:hypothetical protein G6F56_004843 [Rhizopus delemar]